MRADIQVRPSLSPSVRHTYQANTDAANSSTSYITTLPSLAPRWPASTPHYSTSTSQIGAALPHPLATTRRPGSTPLRDQKESCGTRSKASARDVLSCLWTHHFTRMEQLLRDSIKPLIVFLCMHYTPSTRIFPLFQVVLASSHNLIALLDYLMAQCASRIPLYI